MTLVKPDSGTVGFINFIPSVLEEISDVSAMGTPGQDEFQSFWGGISGTVIGDTFSWSTGTVEEPLERKVDPPASAVFTRTSTTATFDVSTHHDKLVFGDTSALDDILVMIKPGEDVTDDWDTVSGGETRPHVTFTLPANSIVIANNRGRYVFNGDDNFWPTCEKTVSDGSSSMHLPDGDGVTTQYDYNNLITAGFDPAFFADGITVADLTSKGFITAGVLSFKLVHIVCGGGGAWINDMGLVSDETPTSDPDDVGGWVRDWSYRKYNSWDLVQLEGNSSLAAALWCSQVSETSLDTARWGAGLDSEYFNIQSFEALHARCVAGWKFANEQRTVVSDGGSDVTFPQTYRFAERFKFDYLLDSQTGITELTTGQMLACCNGFRYLQGGVLHVGIPLPGAFPVWHFMDERITDGVPEVGFASRAGRINRVWVQYRDVRDEDRINFGNGTTPQTAQWSILGICLGFKIPIIEP